MAVHNLITEEDLKDEEHRRKIRNGEEKFNNGKFREPLQANKNKK